MNVITADQQAQCGPVAAAARLRKLGSDRFRWATPGAAAAIEARSVFQRIPRPKFGH
jgi:hypothetical protein